MISTPHVYYLYLHVLQHLLNVLLKKKYSIYNAPHRRRNQKSRGLSFVIQILLTLHTHFV